MEIGCPWWSIRFIVDFCIWIIKHLGESLVCRFAWRIRNGRVWWPGCSLFHLFRILLFIGLFVAFIFRMRTIAIQALRTFILLSTTSPIIILALVLGFSLARSFSLLLIESIPMRNCDWSRVSKLFKQLKVACLVLGYLSSPFAKSCLRLCWSWECCLLLQNRKSLAR